MISRTDALSALRQIEQTEARGSQARTYRVASSALLLWGGVWAVAYTAVGLLPAQDWWYAWVPGNLIGGIGTYLLCRQAPRAKAGATQKWPGFHGGGIVIASICLITSLYFVDPPRTAAVGQVLVPLVIAFVYAMVGLQRLPRYLWIAGFLFVATLFGFFALPHIFAFWMAAVGGGALAASGLWLRRA